MLERIRNIPNRLNLMVEDLQRRNLAFAVLVEALRGFNEDNCIHLAAGVAYYAVFSIFPLILALIALSSFLFQTAEAQDAIISGVTSFLPGSGELVRRNINLVLRERGAIGIFAAITLLWAAKAVFGAITTSLNLAWNVQETRPFLRLTALQLALVFGVGLVLLLSLILTAALQLFLKLQIPVLGRAPFGDDAWSLLVALIPLVLTIISFYMVYRFVPNKRVAPEEAWPGAITAGVLFEIAKNGFVYYTSNFANFRVVYGSVAVFIVLLFWAWLSGVILLFGAEICSEYSKLRRRR